jgi:hypothetical protein
MSNLAVLREDLVDHPFAVAVGADVALVDAGTGVCLAEAVGGFLVARVPRGHRDSAGGEAVGDRGADAADAPGDQCDLSGHVGHG